MDDAQAKLLWFDPYTGERREHLLTEGSSVSIGRSASNDIQIAEGHVSRAHALVSCREREFRVDDLSSANGTFVNGNRVEGSSPLALGDEIHLFVTMMRLIRANADPAEAAALGGDQASLRIIKGPQRGQVFALLKDEIYIGRSTPNSTWEIALQDPTVSRPHAFLVKESQRWKLFDLGSVNGTSVNRRTVTGGKAEILRDGDRIMFGATASLFRMA